jgi:multidrug efflux pump subunit AcrA (membrane-fusion protein)
MNIIYFLLGLILLCSCGRKNAYTPVYRKLAEAVYAGGSIHPLNEYKVYPALSGIITQRYVNEGDIISKGQILFETDSREQNLREFNARIARDYAGSNAAQNSPAIAEAQAGADNAYQRYLLDSSALDRTYKLFLSKAASQAELDKAKSAAGMSASAWKAAWKKYQALSENLLNQQRSAQKQLEIATLARTNYQIRSLINGRIYAVYREIGELAQQQQPLALAGHADSAELHLIIDIADIARIKGGQELYYTMDAYPGKKFRAIISRIIPVLDPETQSCKAIARCSTTPPIVMAGAQIQANIIVSTKEKALVIPRSYLRPGPSVMLSSGTIRPVRTGIITLDEAEIIQGIEDGEQILPVE